MLFPCRREVLENDPTPCSSGWRCFYAAVAGDHEECIHALLEAGVDEFVYLIEASEKGCQQCVRLLLQAGATVNTPAGARVNQTRNKKIISISLLKAARNGHSGCVNLLLEAGASVNRQDWLGETALSLAAGKGHDGCVKMLLEAGADVNKRDADGYTALMEAAYGGHDSSMQLLLDSGADVTVCSRKGCETALLLAGNSHCVKLLLDAGACVNAPAVNGRTALMHAARDGNVNSVKLLVDAGADVNATMCYHSLTSCYGVTALHHTACFRVGMVRCNHRNKIECVRLLLRAGARINMFDSRGNNALTWNFHYSKTHSQEQILLLLAAGESLQVDKITDSISCCAVFTAKDLNLSNICRETIRKHLLRMSNVNLFVRVPKLGLPTALAAYLLYNTSVINNDSEIDDNSDDDRQIQDVIYNFKLVDFPSQMKL